MKTIYNTHRKITTILVIIFLIPILAQSQSKRVKPPKRVSKIASVDQFVDQSFELYHKVFVYDSLTSAGIEVPMEIEDELVERIEQDIDSLWQAVPDITDDISDASFMRQAKATINLNRAKKALKFCMNTAKAYFIGTEEDDESDK